MSGACIQPIDGNVAFERTPLAELGEISVELPEFSKTDMNGANEATVFAVQSAFLELLELTQAVAPGDDPDKQEALRQEAQKTVLMFIAAIILSNRDYNPAQKSFISVLVDCQDMPGGEARYLNEYAVRWVEASKKAPEFFNLALQRDSAENTDIARGMLRQIQLIGNNVAAADGSVSAFERNTIQIYVMFLESLIEANRFRVVSEVEPAPAILPEPVEPEPINRQEFDRLISIPVTPPRRNAELYWIPPGNAINVGDYQIPAGMIYVSDGRSSIAEASAINLRLPVGRPTQGDAARLNYYPQYFALTPDQRANYLEWLASYRKDEDPSSRELGYVFLFFYGLERRLLVEKGQEQEVVAEIVRLLHQYGSLTRSRSLQSYGCQLIHYWGWQQGPEYYAQLLEWMKTLPVSLLGEDELAVVLASHFQSGKALTSDMAYELASRNEDARRSVVVSRVNREFRELFAKRFAAQFSEGMTLNRSKRTARLSYRPASPTLLYGGTDKFAIQIPDVLGLSGQFKILPKIWNACVEDLTGYSRAKFKTGGSGESLKAYSALPADLRAGAVHPLACKWEQILTTAHAGKDCALVDVGTAAQLLDIEQRAKLTPGQSRELAGAIESLGFVVEPDARYDSAYAWDQELAVFKPASAKVVAPSKNYLGASVLLKLCVLVAGADGNVAPEELEVSRRFVQKRLTLTPEDHKRLEALEQILIADPNRVSASLARISRPVPKEQRELICEVLVYVAAADNVVTKEEIRTLERIFKAFELPPEKLDAHLKAISPEFGEVTIQAGGTRIPGEPIPSVAQPFHIDMARVDRIAQETSEVVGILAKAMAEEEPEHRDGGLNGRVWSEGIETIPAVPASADRAEPAEKVPEWVGSLEPKYQKVLLELLQRETWQRADFEALAKKFKLMPLDAFDAINGWADENLGDFLLEGEQSIVIHKNLIP